MEELTYQPQCRGAGAGGPAYEVVGLVDALHPSVDAIALLPFIETIAAVAREHDHDVLLVTADEGPRGWGASRAGPCATRS